MTLGSIQFPEYCPEIRFHDYYHAETADNGGTGPPGSR